MARIKLSSGDKYAAWEAPKITRQGFANAQVERFRGLFVPDVDFATLLTAFRAAGDHFDTFGASHGNLHRVHVLSAQKRHVA